MTREEHAEPTSAPESILHAPRCVSARELTEPADLDIPAALRREGRAGSDRE